MFKSRKNKTKKRKRVVCQGYHVNSLKGFHMFQCGIFVKYSETLKCFHNLIMKLMIIDQVQFSCSVMSNSLQPHELQHTRPPCPSPTPGVHPNPCPLSRWCDPTISSSVVPFSSCPQSFPASGSFHVSQLFAQVAKVLEFQLQHPSFQWTPRTDLP